MRMKPKTNLRQVALHLAMELSSRKGPVASADVVRDAKRFAKFLAKAR